MRQKSQIVKKIIAILTTCVVALPTMPAYAKTEDEMIDEVQIHTPVMSPGTIYGGDGSPANNILKTLRTMAKDAPFAQSSPILYPLNELLGIFDK